MSAWVEPTGAQPSRLQRPVNEAHASEDACAPVYDPSAYADGTDST